MPANPQPPTVALLGTGIMGAAFPGMGGAFLVASFADERPAAVLDNLGQWVAGT
jgi:hypothetical protein